MPCWLRCSCWAMVCSSAKGRFRRSNSTANRAKTLGETCPLSSRFITFMRDWASVICPDKNTSASPSRHCWSCDKKVDSLDSCTGKAQGSPKWSASAPWADMASSRKIKRVQSMAPVIIRLVWLRPRSAVSISTCRHCCHKAALAKVVTNATASMAVSKAAPLCVEGRLMRARLTKWGAPSPC